MAGKLARMATPMPLPGEVDVWPENLESVAFFTDYCPTQWRVGINGITGLDYTAVLACLRSLRLSSERREELFADVRSMESAALGAMHAK